MEFTPSINRVKELSKNGLYDVVPVSCEILSDFTTPIETMRILNQFPATAICWSQLRPTRPGDGIHF